MRSDLDNLMEDRGLDAIVVIAQDGQTSENHALHYITKHAPVTQALVLKKRGEDAVMLVSSMERDEAAKSGLAIETYSDYDYYTLIKEAGNYFEGSLKLYEKFFATHNVSGTVGFYGQDDPGKSFMRLKRLDEMMPHITVTGEVDKSIFDEAFATKDEIELDEIKSVAERTNQVMAETMDFVRGHKAVDGRLVKDDGSPLTIGEVKAYVRQRLMTYQLEESHGMIFAIGRDAGVPHSRGEDDDELELGKSIIFDLFPRQMDGGYFHDMTRTFCLGYAPPEVQRAYDEVMVAFDEAMKALKVGEAASTYQEITCEVLEEFGHPTIRDNPTTTEGYVHSLGHGIGLEIHSRPSLSSVSKDVLEPGQVFTVEPGVYYPSKGYGVRIEDSVYFDAQGELHVLTTYPKDLVVPVEGYNGDA